MSRTRAPPAMATSGVSVFPSVARPSSAARVANPLLMPRGGQRPLSDRTNSRLTSGLSAPVSRCRRSCRKTAFLRFSSARRRPIASTVTSHGPQDEQSSSSFAAKGRRDAVRPQKRHTTISESLTRRTRSPLRTGPERAGRAAAPRARRHAFHAPHELLKNPARPEVHATRGSYSRPSGSRGYQIIHHGFSFSALH